MPVDDDVWSLIAVPGEGKSLLAAEEAFDQLFAQIAARVDPFPLSKDDSDVVPLDQLPAATLHASYRLDLANVPFGSRSAGQGHARPSL